MRELEGFREAVGEGVVKEGRGSGESACACEREGNRERGGREREKERRSSKETERKDHNAIRHKEVFSCAPPYVCGRTRALVRGCVSWGSV